MSRRRSSKTQSFINKPEPLSETQLEINEVFHKLKGNLEIGHFILSWDTNQEPLVPKTDKFLLLPETIRSLETIQTHIASLLEKQKCDANIIKAQAIIRGCMVRKQTARMYRVIPQVKVAKTVFINLVKTEKTYLEKLRRIIQQYLIPMRTKLSETDTMQDIIAIFSTIETIAQVNERLYSKIISIRNSSWPAIQGLGRAFLEIAPELKCYGVFAENYKTSQITLKKVLGQKKSRLKGVIEKEDDVNDILIRLLMAPLDRIASYEETLGGLCSIPSSVLPGEYEYLQRAHNVIQNINKQVQRSIKRADVVMEIQEIERNIQSDRPLNLQEVNRFLVASGTLYCSTHKKIQYHLFNDFLLLSKQDAKGKMKLLHRSPFDNVVVTLSDINGTYHISITGVTLDLKESKNDLNSLRLISSTVTDYKKSETMFGLQLEELLARENSLPKDKGCGVPHIVTFLSDYIIKHGLQSEGLLRLAGSYDKIESLKSRLDGPSLNKSVDLSKENIDDVAAVLRTFYRELPEPVVSFDLYEPLLEIQRDNSIPLDVRVRKLSLVLAKICPTHLPLLKYLIDFLQRIEECCDVNKMTVSNLALIFAPNIIRPEVETIENALEMPLLQGIVQLLIENSDTFWSHSEIVLRKLSRNETRRKRALSKIFVGSELRLFDPNAGPSTEEVPLLSFRSLARGSPATRPVKRSPVKKLPSLELLKEQEELLPDPVKRLSVKKIPSLELLKEQELPPLSRSGLIRSSSLPPEPIKGRNRKKKGILSPSPSKKSTNK